jgi:hypothetical protein
MQHWGIPSRFKPSRECGISAKAIINTGSRKRVGKRFRAGASGARQASQSKSGSPRAGLLLMEQRQTAPRLLLRPVLRAPLSGLARPRHGRIFIRTVIGCVGPLIILVLDAYIFDIGGPFDHPI